MSQEFTDFTLEAYAALLDKAAARYRFVQFGDGSTGDGRALWRHDIDFSPHRALAMAELEAARGLCTTYFLQLTSSFYNVLEPDNIVRLHQIADLGHTLGIHFEPSGDAPVERLNFEARTLETAFASTIVARAAV